MANELKTMCSKKNRNIFVIDGYKFRFHKYFKNEYNKQRNNYKKYYDTTIRI